MVRLVDIQISSKKSDSLLDKFSRSMVVANSLRKNYKPPLQTRTGICILLINENESMLMVGSKINMSGSFAL